MYEYTYLVVGGHIYSSCPVAVASFYYTCPHTTLYVSSYPAIYVSSRRVVIALYLYAAELVDFKILVA